MKPPILRYVRYVLWVLVAAICLLTIGVGLGWLKTDFTAKKTEPVNLVSSIGGAFSGTDHQGNPFTEKNIAGKPVLIFFGFTHCPDICPSTLADITQMLEGLGTDGNRIVPLFVSVDPERDTREQMANYLTMFDTRIIGLSLTPKELTRMEENYKFYYKKISTKDNYTMDHTAGVYLIDKSGQFVGTLDLHESLDIRLQKLKMLITR